MIRLTERTTERTKVFPKMLIFSTKIERIPPSPYQNEPLTPLTSLNLGFKILIPPRHWTLPLTLLSPSGDKRNCYHHNLLSIFHGLYLSYIWLHISNYLNHKEVIHFRKELHFHNFLVISLYKISNSLPIIKKVIT